MLQIFIIVVYLRKSDKLSRREQVEMKEFYDESAFISFYMKTEGGQKAFFDKAKSVMIALD